MFFEVIRKLVFTFVMALSKARIRLLLISVLIGAGGSFHFSFHSTALNTSESVFRSFVNQSFNDHYGYYLYDSVGSYRIVWSILTSLTIFGDFLAACSLAWISEKLGRKRGLLLASGLMAMAASLEASSKWMRSLEAFGVGRLLRGMSQGWAVDIQTMFISESSPIEMRGMCGGCVEVIVQIGTIVGGVLALPELLGTDRYWPMIFLLEIAPISIMWLAFVFIPESPKYLASKGQSEEARRALRFFRHSDVDESMRQIEAEIIICRDRQPPFLDLFRIPALRRGLFFGVLAWLISIFSGTLTLEYFSTRLLVDVGVAENTARYLTVGLACQTLVAALIGSYVIDRVGRRRLLLVTSAGLAIMHTMLMTFTVLFSKYGRLWYGYVCVVAQFLVFFLYGIGPAVLQWTVISEMVPQNARSKALAFSNSLAILTESVIQLTFLPLNGVVGGFSFAVFALPLTSLAVVAYFTFPETKGRSTAEIVDRLGDGFRLKVKTSRKDVVYGSCS